MRGFEGRRNGQSGSKLRALQRAGVVAEAGLPRAGARKELMESVGTRERRREAAWGWDKFGLCAIRWGIDAHGL